MPRTYKCLTLEQRIQISDMLSKGKGAKEISKSVGCHIASIYREIDRGRNEDGVYDPYYAEKNRAANKAKGKPEPVLLSNKDLAQRIADFLIAGEGSVADAIVILEAEGYEMPTKTTIYASIDKGLIPGVTRETLRKNQTTIFNDGQIHIPKWMREDLGWKDGDGLTLETVDGDGILIQRADKAEDNE